MFSLPDTLKVDKPVLHIRMDQLHAELVADVHAFKTALQFSFNGGVEYADPRPMIRGTGDDGIESIPDPRFK